MHSSAVAPRSPRLRGRIAIVVLWMTLAPVSLAHGERIEDRWSRLEIPSGFKRTTSMERIFEEMVRKAASATPARSGETETAQARVFARDAGHGSSDIIVMGHASGRLPLPIAAPGYAASF